MAWSRVDSGNTVGGSSGGGGMGSTTTSEGSSSGSSSSQSSQSQSSQSQNMSDQSLAALEALIAQLLSGGTQTQVNEQAQRGAEINTNRQIRDTYGKDNAFADAQGAMAQQLRKVMESIIPSLTRAAEGSGTSQNSMRALMVQEAANRAAESSSALGLDAATKYGQVSTSLSNVLEALTRPQDTVTQALVNALNVAKGAVTSGTSTSVGTQSGSNSSNNSNTNTGSGGGGGGSNYSTGGNNAVSGSGGFSSYGSNWDPTQLNSQAWGELMNQYGASNGSDLASILNDNGFNERFSI